MIRKIGRIEFLEYSFLFGPYNPIWRRRVSHFMEMRGLKDCDIL